MKTTEEFIGVLASFLALSRLRRPAAALKAHKYSNTCQRRLYVFTKQRLLRGSKPASTGT